MVIIFLRLMRPAGDTQPNTMNKDKVAGPFSNLNNWCVRDTVRANFQRHKYHYYQYQTPTETENDICPRDRPLYTVEKEHLTVFIRKTVQCRNK